MRAWLLLRCDERSDATKQAACWSFTGCSHAWFHASWTIPLQLFLAQNVLRSAACRRLAWRGMPGFMPPERAQCAHHWPQSLPARGWGQLPLRARLLSPAPSHPRHSPASLLSPSQFTGAWPGTLRHIITHLSWYAYGCCMSTRHQAKRLAFYRLHVYASHDGAGCLVPELQQHWNWVAKFRLSALSIHMCHIPVKENR